jgi:hypothetical protein
MYDTAPRDLIGSVIVHPKDATGEIALIVTGQLARLIGGHAFPNLKISAQINDATTGQPVAVSRQPVEIGLLVEDAPRLRNRQGLAPAARAGPVSDHEGERRALRLNEFCQLYGLSRATAYKLMAAGKLRTVLVGGRRLVPVDAAEALIAE